MNEPKTAASKRQISKFAAAIGLHLLVIIVWNGGYYLCNSTGLNDLSTCLKMGPILSKYFMNVWTFGWVAFNGAIVVGQVTLNVIRFRRRRPEEY